jgi:hypothetical protein
VAGFYSSAQISTGETFDEPSAICTPAVYFAGTRVADRFLVVAVARAGPLPLGDTLKAYAATVWLIDSGARVLTKLC